MSRKGALSCSGDFLLGKEWKQQPCVQIWEKDSYKNNRMWKGYFKISLDKKPKHLSYRNSKIYKISIRAYIVYLFIFEATLQSHLNKYEKPYPKEIEEIKTTST